MPINEKPMAKNITLITVDDEGDGDFTSIQDAVNHAKDGDVILVYSGEYNESVKIENKSIEIRGVSHELGKGNDTGKPVIIQNNVAIEIYSCNCSIGNFTVYGEIDVFGDYNEIWDNRVVRGKNGIYVKNGKGNRIYGNIVAEAIYGGIVTHYAPHSIILCNTIENTGGTGIITYYSPFTIIQHNIVENSGGGVACDCSRETMLIENNIFNCKYGIDIYFSLNVLVKHNNLINNSRQACFENAYFCIWYENYWSNWHIPLPKPIFGTMGGVIIWWIFGIVIPWIQFDWHPLMQPYEWWKK